jgi:hypothetical protein
MVHFDECEHKWVFQTNAINNTMIWRTTFQCKNCNQCITLEEKCALEQTEIANKAFQEQKESSEEQLKTQEKSLKIQEDSLNTAKKAMIISAIAMSVSVV